MKGDKLLFSTWALALVLVAWDSLGNGSGFPPPRRFIGVNAAWSILAVLGSVGSLATLAGALGAGVDVTLAVAVFSNKGSGKALGAASSVGNGLGTAGAVGAVGAGIAGVPPVSQLQPTGKPSGAASIGAGANNPGLFPAVSKGIVGIGAGLVSV